MKNDLQKEKLESRKKYEETVASGEVEAKKMKSDKINTLESLLSEAEKILLENL